jgi:putative PIN family toxin of toxin-antitoxin system
VRVVLDTNIVVSGVFWRGKPFAILRAWAGGRLSVVGSPEILWEYERVLLEVAKGKVTTDLENWLTFLQDRIELLQPGRQIELCRDPMDDMFLSCAVAAHAACIVSGDQDLLVLKSVEGIPILNAAVFHSKHAGLFSS